MLCQPLCRGSQTLLVRTRGVRKLKFVDRFYRAESPTVINGVAKAETSRSDDVSSLKSVEDMPGPEGLCALPYIGSMFLFHPFTNYVPEKSNLLFEELYRKYGRIVKFRKGGKWSVLLYDPDLIQEAMSYEGRCPYRPSPPLADVYAQRTGKEKGISQVQGEEWLKMRRPVQEFLLQPANINQYTPILDEIATELATCISQARDELGRVPLSNIMLRYAIESAAVYCINTRLGFLQSDSSDTHGSSAAHPDPAQCPHAQHDNSSHSMQPHNQRSTTSFRALTEEERTEMLKKIKTYMKSVGSGYYTFPTYKLYRSKLYKEFEDATNYLSSVIQSRLADLAQTMSAETGQRSEEVNERPNLMRSLLSDGRLGLKACTSMLTGFFSTATDNISNSMCIFLWHLAKNGSKQSKLRQEILERIPSSQHTPQDVLSHMPYLKACLKESHRLTFPTPFGSVRVIPEDIVLGGYHIPAGTAVNFGHNVLGHSPEYFENPEEYRPERWLKQVGSSVDSALRRRQSIITMPFGFGLRNCVGRRLAEQQIYLALIKILRAYELKLGNEDEELDVVYKITASSSRPLDIRFIPLDARDTSRSNDPGVL